MFFKKKQDKPLVTDSSQMWKELKDLCSENWCCKALRESIQAAGPLFISIHSGMGTVTLKTKYCPACGRKLYGA